MQESNRFKFVVRMLATVFAASMVAACGGGGGGGDGDGAIAGGPGQGGGGGSDNVAPTIAITSPDNDGSATVTDNTVTIAGRATDNVGVQTLTWRSNRGGQGSITVRTNWESAAITLQNGMNVITVEAEDAAGNKSQDEIAIVQETATNADQGVAMISYNSDLSNATVLEDATVQAGFAYLFFEPSPAWESLGVTQIDFYCCKALSGQSQGHLPRVVDGTAPFVLPIDLGQFEGGTLRELYVDVYFGDGSQDNQFVEFNLESTVGGNGNAAPTISGSPRTQVTAGQVYDFTPAANDNDGDVLTFTIQNKPAWADFNVQTGRLSGTPGSSDAGNYNNIRIGVTDGQASSSLSPFSITVSAVSNASLTINWTPPTQNVDGSPIAGLDSFKIYYGQNSGSYPNVVDVNNAGLTSYTIDNLAPGTWYLAMTATDTNGLESALSYEITKTAQ